MRLTCRERIVVIEDDRELARILRVLLEWAGYQVHTEHTGAEGLAYLAHTESDLILLDLRLPDMNGYEVCRRLRHVGHRWPLPVVMLTGMDKPIDQLRGFAYGADVYLTKPCDMNELLKAVKHLLGPKTSHAMPQH